MVHRGVLGVAALGLSTLSTPAHSLSVVSPSRDLTVVADRTYTVEWTGTSGRNLYEIDLYYCGSFCMEGDCGEWVTALCPYGATGCPDSEGDYDIVLPEPLTGTSGSGYKVRVQLAGDESTAACSDEFYLMASEEAPVPGDPDGPYLIVTKPEGGDIASAGFEYTVEFDYDNGVGSSVDRFKIDLYREGGSGDCGTWVENICDKPSIGCKDSMGDYDVLIPETVPSGYYRIRVGRFENDSLYGCSGTFEVESAVPSSAFGSGSGGGRATSSTGWGSGSWSGPQPDSGYEYDSGSYGWDYDSDGYDKSASGYDEGYGMSSASGNGEGSASGQSGNGSGSGSGYEDGSSASGAGGASASTSSSGSGSSSASGAGGASARTSSSGSGSSSASGAGGASASTSGSGSGSSSASGAGGASASTSSSGSGDGGGEGSSSATDVRSSSSEGGDHSSSPSSMSGSSSHSGGAQIDDDDDEDRSDDPDDPDDSDDPDDPEYYGTYDYVDDDSFYFGDHGSLSLDDDGHYGYDSMGSLSYRYWDDVW